MRKSWNFYFFVGLFFLAQKNNWALAEEKFEKTSLVINKTLITVELALNEKQQSQGLMFRKNLAQNKGMLFVFPDEQYRNFWMKNTWVDLSLGFFDGKKILVDIQDMKKSQASTQSPDSCQSKKPARYVLEVPKGWFKKNKIHLGSQFHLPKRNGL